ncbi:uncharacterized protein LOC121770311 [Salvia splendens]|uniref:uncharacterized protein LOC121770311 n=1 Tax=Salvia splendens TaxID=180675 RepID=UPI001C27895D|nr:uncharacterized protein LOC121770311 [Salvia splendens]
MEAFNFEGNSVKSNGFPAIICGVGQIKKLFRIAEILTVLILLTWTLTRLPFAVRISGEYIRWLVNIVVSHLFIFFLSNAIVLILFYKSRSLFLHHGFHDHREIHVDFGQDFVTSGADFSGSEEIVYEDKQTIFEVTRVRAHRRSRSANFRRERSGGNCERQLRRSETELRRRVEEKKAAAAVVDKLSNEDFQRAIEAFIAKQIKFHQDEKLTIVLHGCN